MIKTIPQWFDGKTNTEEDDWTGFEYAYESKELSKLKTNKNKMPF
jgi:hypothetical protein